MGQRDGPDRVRHGFRFLGAFNSDACVLCVILAYSVISKACMYSRSIFRISASDLRLGVAAISNPDCVAASIHHGATGGLTMNSRSDSRTSAIDYILFNCLAADSVRPR